MTLRPPGFRLLPIGRVESSLTDVASAPKQGSEGVPDAWLVFEPGVLDGLADLRSGDRIIVVTWLDRARRDVLRVHPRDDPANPERGVFSTRSADRPNPIGSTPSRSSSSMACGSGSATSRPWTEHRSST